MNRRGFVCVLGATILGGCTTAGNSSNEQGPQNATEDNSSNKQGPQNATENIQIRVDAEEVSPGQTGTVTIVTQNFVGIGPQTGYNETITLDYENERFSKRPGVVNESYPPSYNWGSTQSEVTIDMPFHVPADTQPRNYTESIFVWAKSNYSNGITEQYTVTVENGSTQK